MADHRSTPPAGSVTTTEATIRRATIGEPVRLDGPVVLVDYSTEWLTLFEAEAHRIRSALGSSALAVEHAGSTSVPGLAAKPILDIVLAVGNSADEPAYVPALEAAGFELRIREPEWYEHRLLRASNPAVNLHVFSVGCEEIDRMLVFRDRLRSHDEERELYEQTKRRLAGRHWDYVQMYADAKSEVVKSIIARARAEAAEQAAAAEDAEFYRVYGPWATHSPTSAAELLEGFPAPWWISGGWSIEAFTQAGREHEDVDVTIFRRDVGRLRTHFAGRYDLWVAGSGTMRPLNDRRPRVPGACGQIWMREHALAPWQLDIVLNPGTHRRWVFKRDYSVTRPFEQATWVARDGLRYLRPELTLAHKVALDRPKDRVDLAATWPILAPGARDWLAAYILGVDPSHPWLALVGRAR